MGGLRGAEGNDADRPSYIRTVLRRGYCLIAEVGQRADSSPAAQAPSLAVLPFSGEAPGRDPVHLGVGIAEALLWSRDFHGTLSAVFAFQDDIALGIVNALKVELTSARQAQPMDLGTGDIQAEEAYLLGTHEHAKHTLRSSAAAGCPQRPAQPRGKSARRLHPRQSRPAAVRG